MKLPTRKIDPMFYSLGYLLGITVILGFVMILSAFVI